MAFSRDLGNLSVKRTQKGGFVKGWFWPMYPRASFLVSPYPLNLGGAISPPKILGVECLKAVVLLCFLGAAP